MCEDQYSSSIMAFLFHERRRQDSALRIFNILPVDLRLVIFSDLIPTDFKCRGEDDVGCCDRDADAACL